MFWITCQAIACLASSGLGPGRVTLQTDNGFIYRSLDAKETTVCLERRPTGYVCHQIYGPKAADLPNSRYPY